MALKKCVKEPKRGKKNSSNAVMEQRFGIGWGCKTTEWMILSAPEEGGRMKKVVLDQYEIIALGMSFKYIWNSEREE